MTQSGQQALPPFLSFGTWPLQARACQAATSIALEVGFRSIDTAEAYGNEIDVGKSIRDSGIKRESLFITSKFNSHSHRVSIRGVLEASLEHLQLDYLDAYLIHWPCPWLDKYANYWQQVLELQNQGLVRSAGVSNFLPEHLNTLLQRSGVLPSFNQIQLNPFVARPEQLATHRLMGVATQAWSPLGRGRYWTHSQARSIANDAGVSLPQILLAWHRRTGNRVVVHSHRRSHLKQLVAWQGAIIDRATNLRLRVLNGLETQVPDSNVWGH